MPEYSLDYATYRGALPGSFLDELGRFFDLWTSCVVTPLLTMAQLRFKTLTYETRDPKLFVGAAILLRVYQNSNALPLLCDFLACGILAHGFLRLCCSECGHEKLVAFSCKRRGFCPSCGARRMAETAAHLVDCVIPPVAVRQWVLSLPIPLRLLFAAQPQLLAPLLHVIHRVIAGFLVKRAGFTLSRADTGVVTLIQRFGSAANLNIHLHCLVLDGVCLNRDGVPLFHE